MIPTMLSERAGASAGCPSASPRRGRFAPRWADGLLLVAVRGALGTLAPCGVATNGSPVAMLCIAASAALWDRCGAEAGRGFPKSSWPDNDHKQPT